MATRSISINSNKRCALCTRRISKTDKTNLHHTPTLRSHGGQTVVEVHEACHRNHHKSNGDFAKFGRLSAIDGHWAFYLRGVKDNPFYQPVRDFHTLFYSKPQSRKGTR